MKKVCMPCIIMGLVFAIAQPTFAEVKGSGIQRSIDNGDNSYTPIGCIEMTGVTIESDFLGVKLCACKDAQRDGLKITYGEETKNAGTIEQKMICETDPKL